MAEILCSAKRAAELFRPVFEGLLPPGATALSIDYLFADDVANAAAAVGVAGGALDAIDWGSDATAFAPTSRADRAPPPRPAVDFALLAEDPATQAALRNAQRLAEEAAEEEAAAEQPQRAPPQVVVNASAAARTARLGDNAQRGGTVPTASASSAADAAADMDNGDQPALRGPRLEPKEGVILTGFCRMFHMARRFGFIQCDVNGEDLYVSAEDVIDGTGTGLRQFRLLFPGEPVSFEVRANTPKSQRRLRAVNVTGIEGAPVYVQNPAMRRTGVVRYFASEKQYGFITPKADPMLGDVFFHATNVVWGVTGEDDREIDVGMVLEYSLLEPDGSVTFNVAQGYKQLQRGSGGEVEGEGAAEATAERREREKRRREKRERDEGPQLVSGFVDEALATW
jgi:cold shock CspA family protein